MNNSTISWDRILVLTPTGNDATHAIQVLGQAGLSGVMCEDCPELVEKLAEGAGVLLIAEEALTKNTVDCLVQVLASQPPWSDVPLLLVTSAAESEEAGQAQLNMLAPHGNITLIERPLRPISLVSALRVALRARRRQYQLRDILAEQQSLLAQTQESERRFRAVFNQQFQFMALLSPEGIVMEINELPIRATGISRDQVEGRLFWDTPFWSNLPEMRKNWPKRLAQAARSDDPVLSTDPFTTADGTVRIADAAVTAVKNAQGEVKLFIIQATDITERKQGEEALRESEARLQKAISSKTVGALSFTLDGRILDANATFQRLSGYSLEELRTTDWKRLTAPEFMEATMRTARNLAEEGETPPYEKSMVRKDGSRWWGLFAPTRLRGSGAESECMEFIIDITERKQAEETLREREAVLRTVTSEAQVGLVMVDKERRYLFTNPTYAEILGLPSANLVGRRVADVLPDLYDQIEPRLDRAFNNERVQYELHIPAHRKTGDERFYDVVYSPRTQGVTEPYVVVVIMDITTRKRSEQKLRDSEERYRSLVSVITDVPWTTDAEGAFVTPQIAWAKFTGQTWDDYRGCGWVNALHPESRPGVQHDWAEACRSQSLYETRGRLFHAASGEYRHIVARAVPVRNTDGSVREWVGSCTDVHEQTMAEQRLERTVAERTAQLRDIVQQLETFSYSIVHDMRAPLRSMRSFADILQTEYSDKLDETARRYIARIMSSASRLDSLITDVLSYSRVSMNEAELQRVNLDRLLRDLLEQYPQFQEASANIQVHRPLPVVLGNTALLTQVFSNLIGNALKFVAPNHTPSVTVRAEPVDGAGRVRVWVEDNGIGIPAEYQHKLFGLFQRLHKADEYAGTGVGLAIVKKAIERMGGTVGLESEPGSGSRFWLELNVMPVPQT